MFFIAWQNKYPGRLFSRTNKTGARTFMNEMTSKPLHILLVEDNEGDILLTTEALEEGGVPHTLSVARDGQEAIWFLEKKGDYANSQTPDIILLDINMPRKNGQEVLAFIKQSDHFRHIPVIMLTTSSSERDIMTSYRNHANCFISKPVEVDEFMEVVGSIEHFWGRVVKLPQRES